jgi:adenosylcobinamide-phosphate synthase
MLTLLTALTLDHFLGEPKRWHPLVAFGNIATAIEQRLNDNTQNFSQRKLMGVLALIAAVLPLSLLAAWIGSNLVIGALLLYLCIGRRSLHQHLQPIEAALQSNDIDAARQAVARIVSRDCEAMTAGQINRAAIESALENGLDAIFATLFWFVVAGPAGAVLHRLVNTLDAMWGYRTERFAAFGWAAARLDDVMAYIPARLLALTYAVLGNRDVAMQCWRTQAAQLASPNGGPVMTAGAGSLGVSLGGPASYHGEIRDKPEFGAGPAPVAADIGRARRLLDHSLLLWLAAIALLQILF